MKYILFEQIQNKNSLINYIQLFQQENKNSRSLFIKSFNLLKQYQNKRQYKALSNQYYSYMEKSLIKTENSQRKTPNDIIQRKFPNKQSFSLPSFTGISSDSTFQQTNNHIKTTQRSSTNLASSLPSTQQLNLINDGVEYVFEFTNSDIQNDDIFDIFEELSRQHHFQMIQREENHSTAIKQIKNSSIISKVSLTQWLTGCLPFLYDKSEDHIVGNSITSKAPTAIKIIISKVLHESKQLKIARIKGLSGSVQQIRVYIQKFKQKISHYLPEGSQQYSNYFFYDTEKQAENETKKSIEHSDPYHLQITTFYVIEKILSNDTYQIGHITHGLIEDFRSSFKNIEQSVGLVPVPINNAVKIVNQIFYWFSLKNNQSQGKQNKKKTLGSVKNQKNAEHEAPQRIKKVPLHESMTPFIRISIEKFVFKKLSFPITDIYKMKNRPNEQIFINKRAKIFEKYSTRQILQETSLNQKFWAVGKQAIKEIDHIHAQRQTRDLLKMSSYCCSELQKITLTSNPRQKVKHMELAYTSLKTFYYDYSKQKYQLSSMQDIIPVLIVIILLLRVEDLRQQLDIMGDFIDSDPYEMDSQKRLYINLSVILNPMIGIVQLRLARLEDLIKFKARLKHDEKITKFLKKYCQRKKSNEHFFLTFFNFHKFGTYQT